MSNRSDGHDIANMNNVKYQEFMGAKVSEEVKNTGFANSFNQVNMYFDILSNYALNRIHWTSNAIDEQELRLIEWNIFMYGYCALLKPRIVRQNISFQIDKCKVYTCAFSKINFRTGMPERISLNLQSGANIPIEVNYNKDEFTLFTDNFALINNYHVPFAQVTYEFANKLYELDLAFNANSHRNRMPFVFNNGASEVAKSGVINVIADKGVSIAELMRSAYGRNEQFVEVAQSMVGDRGFMFEPAHVENLMLEHLESQKHLYEAYFELLGLYTNKEKKGVYTIKDLQENGDETGDYRTECWKSTRIICAKDAVKKFGIELTMEVV